jgi:hypothetical protein
VSLVLRAERLSAAAGLATLALQRAAAGSEAPLSSGLGPPCSGQAQPRRLCVCDFFSARSSRRANLMDKQILRALERKLSGSGEDKERHVLAAQKSRTQRGSMLCCALHRAPAARSLAARRAPPRCSRCSVPTQPLQAQRQHAGVVGELGTLMAVLRLCNKGGAHVADNEVRGSTLSGVGPIHHSSCRVLAQSLRASIKRRRARMTWVKKVCLWYSKRSRESRDAVVKEAGGVRENHDARPLGRPGPQDGHRADLGSGAADVRRTRSRCATQAAAPAAGLLGVLPSGRLERRERVLEAERGCACKWGWTEASSRRRKSGIICSGLPSLTTRGEGKMMLPDATGPCGVLGSIGERYGKGCAALLGVRLTEAVALAAVPTAEPVRRRSGCSEAGMLGVMLRRRLGVVLRGALGVTLRRPLTSVGVPLRLGPLDAELRRAASGRRKALFAASGERLASDTALARRTGALRWAGTEAECASDALLSQGSALRSAWRGGLSSPCGESSE